MHPKTRAAACLALSLALVLVSGGCRDFNAGGIRLGDRHVLRGRPAAQGGPELRDEELRRGWVDVTTGDLITLENALSSEAGLGVDLDIDVDGDLPGRVEFFAEGDVTTYTPPPGASIRRPRRSASRSEPST